MIYSFKYEIKNVVNIFLEIINHKDMLKVLKDRKLYLLMVTNFLPLGMPLENFIIYLFILNLCPYLEFFLYCK